MQHLSYPINDPKFFDNLNLENSDVRLCVDELCIFLLEKHFGYKIILTSTDTFKKYVPNTIYFVPDNFKSQDIKKYPKNFFFPKTRNRNLFIDMLLNYLHEIFEGYPEKIRTMYINSIYIDYKKDEPGGVLVIEYYGYLIDNNLKEFRILTEEVNRGVQSLKYLISNHEKNVLSFLNIKEGSAYIVEGFLFYFCFNI